jgi:hypothetical protein
MYEGQSKDYVEILKYRIATVRAALSEEGSLWREPAEGIEAAVSTM